MRQTSDGTQTPVAPSWVLAQKTQVCTTSTSHSSRVRWSLQATGGSSLQSAPVQPSLQTQVQISVHQPLPLPLQKLRLEQSQLRPGSGTVHVLSAWQVAPCAQSRSSLHWFRQTPFSFKHTRWFGQVTAGGQMHCLCSSQLQAGCSVVLSLHAASWQESPDLENSQRLSGSGFGRPLLLEASTRPQASF